MTTLLGVCWAFLCHLKSRRLDLQVCNSCTCACDTDPQACNTELRACNLQAHNPNTQLFNTNLQTCNRHTLACTDFQACNTEIQAYSANSQTCNPNLQTCRSLLQACNPSLCLLLRPLQPQPVCCADRTGPIQMSPFSVLKQQHSKAVMMVKTDDKQIVTADSDGKICRYNWQNPSQSCGQPALQCVGEERLSNITTVLDVVQLPGTQQQLVSGFQASG